jgi:hypothetical protein
VIFDGWRYLGLRPHDVLSLTPREFNIVLKAQRERSFDEMEKEARIAIIREAAHRAKRPKAADLFKRPTGDIDESTLQKKVEQSEHAAEWLSQYEFK